MEQFKYILIHKPYLILSQFTDEGNKKGLSSIYKSFDKDIYPVGRLDADSEGLLLLTNDKSVNEALLHPSKKQEKTYWAQVEGEINSQAIESLSSGVEIVIKGKSHQTVPAKVKHLKSVVISDRIPSIRIRQNIPTSWVEIKVTEGKNRQIRRMTAKVGFPTLRLIRVGIGHLNLDNIKAGEYLEIDKSSIDALLHR